MKKLFTFSLGLMAAFTASAVETPTNSDNNPPIAVLRVFDVSGGNIKVMEGNKLSRSKPRELCLIVGNVPVQESNMFVQYFQAPAKTKIAIPANMATVEAEDNSKNFLISKTVTKAEMPHGEAVFCWRFSKQDPAGEYKLDVQFNDIVFKDLKFKLLK